MILLIECIVACVLFTLMVKLASLNREEAFANDYPPVVTEKLREMNLIAQKPPARKGDLIRKAVAFVLFGVLFALLLRKVNGITTFVKGSLTAFILWTVVDWYDFLVIDILLAPFDKFYKLSGVSAFDKEAVLFHFKGSMKGMLIGVVFAPVVGLLVSIL